MIWFIAILFGGIIIASVIPKSEKQLEHEAREIEWRKKWAEQKHTSWKNYFQQGGRNEALKTIIRLDLQSQKATDLEEQVNLKFQADQWRDYVSKQDEYFKDYRAF
jgi:hypothetical protein